MGSAHARGNGYLKALEGVRQLSDGAENRVRARPAALIVRTGKQRYQRHDRKYFLGLRFELARQNCSSCFSNCVLKSI
jgi:hypothetical protein